MHKLLLRVFLIVPLLSLSLAQAQNYPSKPIRIQTSAAGGATDLASRLLANELGPVLGQPIVVENQTNPTVLALSVAKAAPDGHTLLLWGPGFWLGPLFQDQAPSYDVIRDFASVSMISRSPSILVVPASLPVKTVADLVSLAKSKPGQLNYLTGANGSSEHIAGESFKSLTGTDIVRVPYKGGVVAGVTDLLSGRIQMTFSSGAIWDAHIRAGKARALATGGTRRSTFYPDLPTVAETVPGFVAESVLGLWAPAKTSDAIIKRLNAETIKALDKPSMRDPLVKAGQEPGGGAPDQLTEAVKASIATVTKMVQSGTAAR